MKKKGFTLVELLAIITILGIIVVIAIPSVENTISESKRNKFKEDARTIIKGVEIYLEEEINNVIPETGISLKSLDLPLSGDMTNYTGLVKIVNNEVILEAFSDGTYCGNGSNKDFQITEDLNNCILPVIKTPQ
ncbi:MAG: prepilin-type N-terminal cleavage/methylation domain-containing protein [Bacilli bacterium]